jgi:HEAT repeat protein
VKWTPVACVGFLLAALQDLRAQPERPWPEAKILWPLKEQLGDPSSRERRAAIRSVRGLASDVRHVVASLAGALSDPDPDVRSEAARVLGDFAPVDVSVVPALLRVLDDPYPRVRLAAVDTFGLMGPLAKDAVPHLIRKMQDKDKAVRLRAICALRSVGPYARPAIPALVEALKNQEPSAPPGQTSPAGAAAFALAELGPDAASAVPALLEILNRKDLEQRNAAIVALGHIGLAHERVLPTLLTLLGEQNEPQVRVAAACAIGRIGPRAKEALPALLALLGAPPAPGTEKLPEPCASAVRALGFFGEAGRPAVRPLANIVKDKKAPVDLRREAISALMELGPVAKDAIPDLVSVYFDADSKNAFYGATPHAVSKMGKESAAAVPLLLPKLAEGNELFTRLAAFELLNAVGPKEAKAAVPTLEELAKGKDRIIATEAAKALKRIQRDQ